MRLPLMICMTAALLGIPQAAGAERLVDLGQPFGKLPLVDEVRCGDPADPHEYAEDPRGGAALQTLLGVRCRALPVGPGAGGAAFFAYRLGKNKGLKAGEAHVLAVDYPEDRSRTWHIVNRGCEVFQGFSTGAALGDSMQGYAGSNPESLRLPLSGRMRTWRQLFFLYDRFYGLRRKRDEARRPERPEDGFWVIVVRPDPGDDPMSAGPAVSRIRLFRVPDVGKLYAPLRLPPKGLPRRHVFGREEMADGYADQPRAEPGVSDMARYFEAKARTLRFLGMDTLCTDLLEFGHNQGWDAGDDQWYVPSHDPGRWERVVATAARHGLSLLPYYEYAGSMGLNRQVQCVPLKGPGQPYTRITWGELYHADVTDPRTLEDAKRLLDRTIGRYRGRAPFLGAWFRNRVSHLPISFSDAALERFRNETGTVETPTRARLSADAELLEWYRSWWLGKRRAFFLALRDHLRREVGPGAVVLWTNWTSESGPLIGTGKWVVTDDPGGWKPHLPQWWEARSYQQVVSGEDYLKALTRWPETWPPDEWQHGEPRADPERYRETEGVLFTYPIHRAYSAARPSDLEAFRTRSGLAVVRMNHLNEHRDGGLLGDFLSDVERAGPYCMLAEARAVAHGDPYYLGYLTANTPARGFPHHVRRFHQAFLALPALPSARLPSACDDPEVVVREIRPQDRAQGVYFSVVNTGLQPKRTVDLTLPGRGRLTDAATGRPAAARPASGGKTVVRLSLDACELRALLLQHEDTKDTRKGQRQATTNYQPPRHQEHQERQLQGTRDTRGTRD